MGATTRGCAGCSPPTTSGSARATRCRCRALLGRPWYRACCRHPFGLTGDQNQKTYYETDRGGYRLATSVGGHGSGEHPDRIVCDDPHNVQQAESPAERQAVLAWWDLTMSMRGVSRDARRVIVMQRLHQDDLSGHALGEGDWVHLCLPMRYERGRMPVTPLGWADPRTEEGPAALPGAVQRGGRGGDGEGAGGLRQRRPAPAAAGAARGGHVQGGPFQPAGPGGPLPRPARALLGPGGHPGRRLLHGRDAVGPVRRRGTGTSSTWSTASGSRTRATSRSWRRRSGTGPATGPVTSR